MSSLHGKGEFLPAEPGFENLGFADVVHRTAENVAVEDNEVGQFAGFQRAFLRSDLIDAVESIANAGKVGWQEMRIWSERP